MANLHQAESLDEATELLRAAFFGAPTKVALNSLLHALYTRRRFHEGITIGQRYLALNPLDHESRMRLCRFYFAINDWANGLLTYEHRFQLFPNLMPNIPPAIAQQTRWHGHHRPQHLLLFGEQGFGDMIMFARFVRPILQKGVPVTFIAQPELLPLLKTLDPAPILHDKNAGLTMRPGDQWAHLMSLPFLLNWTPARPHPVTPYLAADPERVKRWRSVLGTHGFKVGLCWHGALGRADSKFKSIPLEQLAPLAQIDGVRLISLQKGEGQEEARSASFPIEVPDQADDDGLFRDTPAIIANLDLTVTVDTAVGHVAGALGCPVYIMVHELSDWRWMHPDATDTLWYPKARLFRQKNTGEWSALISDVANHLFHFGGHESGSMAKI